MEERLCSVEQQDTRHWNGSYHTAELMAAPSTITGILPPIKEAQRDFLMLEEGTAIGFWV